MSASDNFPSGPQPGDTTYASYTPATPAPGPYQTQPSGYQPPMRQGGYGLPIVSLICALVALVLVLAPLHPYLSVAGIAVAIIGVICGHVALAHPFAVGRGLAIAALVFGYVAFVIGLLHVLGALLLGRFLRRRLGLALLRGAV
jgi:hypothetical protein